MHWTRHITPIRQNTVCTKLKENMKIITVLDNNVFVTNSVVIMTSAVHLFNSSVKLLNNDINKTNSSYEHHNWHFHPDNQVQVWVMAYVDLLHAAVALLLRGNTLKVRQFFRSCATHWKTMTAWIIFRLGSVAIHCDWLTMRTKGNKAILFQQSNHKTNKQRVLPNLRT